MPLSTIEAAKESGLVQIGAIAKPLILCQIVAIDGDAVYLTTTPDLGGATRTYNANVYQARLQSNVVDQIQAMSPQGYDIPGAINLQIADGDFAIWKNHASAHGWRGGTLTVLFVLWDAPSGSYTTNAYKWTFTLDKPTIGGDGVLRVSAQSISMTRLTLPSVPRQNRCSHEFPATAAQRLDGLTNPTSIYWGCGYSPDQAGGVGNQTTPNLTNPDGSPLTDSAGNYVSCDYSRSCGPSKGNLNQGCMARLGNYSGTLATDGDITKDTSGRATARFDGDTWVAPQGFSGRQYVNPSAGKIYGFNAPNPATGQTYYNHGYGTQWVSATVLEPASDPNSYRAECVVCVAPQGPATILKVVVNGVEIPPNNSDVIFTYYDGFNGTGGSPGGRTGNVELGAIYDGQGDPHGGLCYIVIVVPSELQASGSIADVQVLVQFPQHLHALPISTAVSSGAANGTVLTMPAGVANLDCAGNPPFAVYIRGNSLLPDGVYQLYNWSPGPPGTVTLLGTFAAGSGTGGSIFYFPLGLADAAMVDSNGVAAANPVWALMDLLAMWGPFSLSDFDVATWWAAAQVCAEQINYTDINGNTATHARYRCSLALTTNNRQSLAKAVLGIRNSAGIILGRNPVNGQLQCYIEQTLADQQPVAIVGSNSSSPIASVKADGTAANGYPAYIFDGNGSIEKNTFKIGGRTINDTPNTISFAFQDSANAWVQDSLTIPDPGGFLTSGNQRVEAPFQMLGIENFDQGGRRINVELAKALYGNARGDAGGTELFSFRTSVKAAHLASRVGYICGIKYDQLGL
ncbi:MAG TPA: hypothetical protein VHA14_14255 [Bryobacteraceae bacterium]|nr:hypothetical protein [Bryobacteraceae bacterium]